MNTTEPRDIFLEALECRSPEERSAFLERTCGADPKLRAEVDSLLRAHEEAGGFLAGLRKGEFDEEAPGGIIGRYKLLQTIGEGGFGVVYMAEQREPVKRRVALKVIKLGMDTRQVIARFEAERQALAMMDHPNIARVLDGGATTAGRPYFVMELVRGVPITQFCNVNKCTPDERLRLVIDVCHAIQHAHQKGIIHRDIKPTNVLVTTHDGRPVPKVIDFGVAKAMQQELTDKTIFTRFHEFIGTPAYMSPEQAQLSGLDIDTRSDIYSLGVLLYELLTGRPPFDSRELLQAGYDQMRKRICEEEPVRPSTRLQTLSGEALSGIARERNTPPDRLRKALRGELDWIVLKCLEKDRSRRYESAAALADDLERYLRDEPVSAAAPSVWYKTRKFAARHKPAVIGSAVITLFLVAATLVSIYFAIRATQAEFRARREAATAEAVSQFLNEDFFGQADPAEEPAPELRVRTSLDRAASQIEFRFRDQPLVEAAVQATIGELYAKLSEYESAEKHLNRAYELRFHELGEQNIDTAEVMMELAFVLLRLNRLDDARIFGERALATALSLFGEDHPKTAHFTSRMAWVYYSVGKGEKATELANRVLDISARRNDIAPVDQASALQMAGRALGSRREREAGEKMLRQALELVSKDQGPTHPRTITLRNNLAAYFLDHEYNWEEAEYLFWEALEQHRRVFGESHFMTIQMRGNLSLLYRKLNRPDEAMAQQIAMLDFNGPKSRAADLEAIRLLLPKTRLKSLLGHGSDSWRLTDSAPLSSWRFPEFDHSEWRETKDLTGPEFWARCNFSLQDVPQDTPFLALHGEADFSVFINGTPIPAGLFRKIKGFQVVILSPDLLRALQRGSNLLAVHCRTTTTDPVTIEFFARPDVPPRTKMEVKP